MRRWIRSALKIARNGRHPEFKFGAIVIRGGSVISRAANFSRPYGIDNRGFHAEERALNESKNYKGATLIVACRTNSGRNHISRPCEICMKLIEQKGITKIIYLNREGNICVERVKKQMDPCYN